MKAVGTAGDASASESTQFVFQLSAGFTGGIRAPD